jgi:hypothetical protein
MPEERKHRSADDRIDKELNDRIRDIRKVWKAYTDGNEEGDPELGSFYEYGLAFDYVEGGTDFNPGAGYFRWQLSWGGPSDEFRFYTDTRGRPYSVEYWFLDWFEGAKRQLTGRDKELLDEIFENFREMGATESALREE